MKQKKFPGNHVPGQAGVSAIIIAGGKSTRMGHDKRAIRLHGRTLMSISICLAEKIADDIIISSNDQLADYRDYRVIPDQIPDEGPLMGMHSCIPYIKSENALLLSCDMPLVSLEMIRQLIKTHLAGHICYFTLNDRIQPFPSIIPVALNDEIRKYVHRGKRSLTGLFSILPTIPIQAEQRFPNDCFLNINRPADLHKAIEITHGKHDFEQEC